VNARPQAAALRVLATPRGGHAGLGRPGAGTARPQAAALRVLATPRGGYAGLGRPGAGTARPQAAALRGSWQHREP
jgi:hypothetical protein